MNTSSTKLKIAALGSGSGSNMQSVLNAINAGLLNAEIRIVLSDVADAGILDRARQNNIRHEWLDCSPFKTKLDGAAEQHCINIMRELDIDTVILAGFMRIVKPGLLTAFAGRIINIHPSLLPNFPGLEAGQQALDAGAKETGCTVHFVDGGIDTGPIIVQRKVEILPDDTVKTLMNRIHAQEHIAYPEALCKIAAGFVR